MTVHINATFSHGTTYQPSTTKHNINPDKIQYDMSQAEGKLTHMISTTHKHIQPEAIIIVMIINSLFTGLNTNVFLPTIMPTI